MAKRISPLLALTALMSAAFFTWEIVYASTLFSHIEAFAEGAYQTHASEVIAPLYFLTAWFWSLIGLALINALALIVLFGSVLFSADQWKANGRTHHGH